jgi:hypothetical protein
MSQVIAFLASGALFAFAVATLLAGHSLWLVARIVIGWVAASLAFILALAAFALVAFRCLSGHAPAGPISGALVIGGALVFIGLAAKVTRRLPLRCAASKLAIVPASKPTPTARGGAARDAIQALVSLGYAQSEATSAISALAVSLGPQADTSTLVKAALRVRAPH